MMQRSRPIARTTLVALSALAAAPAGAADGPAVPAGCHLVWSDEFDGLEIDHGRWYLRDPGFVPAGVGGAANARHLPAEE